MDAKEETTGVNGDGLVTQGDPRLKRHGECRTEGPRGRADLQPGEHTGPRGVAARASNGRAFDLTGHRVVIRAVLVCVLFGKPRMGNCRVLDAPSPVWCN